MCVNPVDYRYLKKKQYTIIYIYTHRCIMIYPAELPKLADFHSNIANDLGHNPTSMSIRWDGAQAFHSRRYSRPCFICKQASCLLKMTGIS